MSAIGIDTHKATLVACAVDERGAAVAEANFDNDPAGHRALAAWCSAVAAGARIGVEGSASYGAPAARHLLALGLAVAEVPPHLSRRERIHTRRAGKSDPGDALAIARVTLRETRLPPVRVDDASRELQLLVEAREDLVAEAIRTRNRLHADLLVLLPGYQRQASQLVSHRALALVRRRLARRPELQARLARERLARLVRVEAEIADLGREIAARVAGHRLLELPGVGPLVAAKLLGEIGDARRFASADAFAAFAGVAPIPASSGQVQRVRLNRGGNRQLNRALFTIALVQSTHHPEAKAFMARKRAEGKSWREALRCLKRHVARRVYRLLDAPATVAEEAA
jgi:transposase